MMFRQLFIGCMVVFGVMVATHGQDEPIVLPFSGIDSISVDNISRLGALTTFDNITKQVKFSPDGTLIAVARQNMDNDYGVLIYNMDTSERVATIQGRMDGFRNMIWSPDSKRLAIMSQRITGGGAQLTAFKTYMIANERYQFGNSDAWYNEEYPFTNSFMSPYPLVWHPDSTLFAVALNNDVRIYDGVQDDPLHIIEIPHVVDLSWSADGKFLMTQTSEGVINLWGLAANL